MTGRKDFRDLVRPVDKDPERRTRVEKPRRAREALISLHELREAVGAISVWVVAPTASRSRTWPGSRSEAT